MFTIKSSLVVYVKIIFDYKVYIVFSLYKLHNQETKNILNSKHRVPGDHKEEDTFNISL